MVLQVVLLPSWGDELANIFSQIGASLPSIFNQEGLKRQEIMDQIAADPAVGQQLASQVRATTAEGAVDANNPGLSSVGETLGLDMSNPESQAFLASIAARFPATLEEQIGALQAGTPQAAAASPMAELTYQVGSDVLKATGAEAKAGTKKSENDLAFETWMQRNNGPAYAGMFKLATDLLGIRTTQEATQAWDQLDEFQRNNPMFAWAMAAGLNNPNFLTYMSQMQEMELRAKLAQLKDSSDPMELLAGLTSLITDQVDLFHAIQEAKANGNDAEVAAYNSLWDALQVSGQQIAGAMGMEWPTIAMPGTERDPITFRLPRKWTAYTTTFEDAAEASRLDTAFQVAVDRIASELYHLWGTPEYGQRFAELRTELQQTPLWEHLEASGALGDLISAVTQEVRSALGVRDTPGGMTEEEKKTTQETVQQFQQELSRQ